MIDNNEKKKTYKFYKMLIKRSKEAKERPEILKTIKF